MAKKAPKQVEAFKHDASRKNIPTAEFESVMAREARTPIRVAIERRNRDLDPQLVWRGKDEKDASDLVVSAPPIYIQEKVHPKVLIDDLRRRTEQAQAEKASSESGFIPDLFADFNGIPKGADKTEFYQHDANWTNRMILGDSLQVMASLAEREGLRGKVQCIYIDPPYGIRFNSNFQWSTTSRDVKDGNVDHITREPEQVRAFRDTWRDGIHSYLSYLRDRLTVARELLTESGSIFVQIGDENVHRVRAVMDEVFGETNRVSAIYFQTTTGQAADILPRSGDFVLWYAKARAALKYRRLYRNKDLRELASYSSAMFVADGTVRKLTPEENSGMTLLPQGWKVYSAQNLRSQDSAADANRRFNFRGHEFDCGPHHHWKTAPFPGMRRLGLAGRLQINGNTPNYIRFVDDYPVLEFTNQWDDTAVAGFSGDKKRYVVETPTKVIQRCVLLSTDPGDLILDPTCGSGTTAFVAEQWGRRWITIDTSRVALALARARIIGARYPYYLLADSAEGQQKEAEVTRTPPKTTATRGNLRHGFVYERVPHITLKSIANNTEIDVIWEKFEADLAPLRTELTAKLPAGWLATYRKGQKYTVDVPVDIQEWEVPREAPDEWPQSARDLLTRFWDLRIARQKEIDASIAAKADTEYLYDKPYEDPKKVRVAGPFTVESLSPHRVLGVDENDELLDSVVDTPPLHGEGKDFATVVLENLRTSGVQQAHKADKITFSSITPWPGRYICATAEVADSGQWLVGSGRSSGQWAVDSGQSGGRSQKRTSEAQSPLPTTHDALPTVRAAIFIGPEFGTVSRPDLVSAAREAGDADFDVLIACAFNYDAHSADFDKLGRIPVLKARMNADLHMAGDLKNTGKGNLFVIFGEPDISVNSGQWIVSSGHGGPGRMVANYGIARELSGLGSLEEINRLGREDLPAFRRLLSGRAVRADQPAPAGRNVGAGKHRGGGGANDDGGVPAVPERGERVGGGGGDAADRGAAPRDGAAGGADSRAGGGHGRREDAQRAQALAALQALTAADFPLSLSTTHYSQVTIHGVDVFHPQTGEVRSDGPEGIACWFIDTDYNEESFFVRHAYFLGANDPYKSLKTTLKAEIDEDAWASLHSDTSRPFDKPKSGRIAVKVINHLGDEVMKVFRVE